MFELGIGSLFVGDVDVSNKRYKVGLAQDLPCKPYRLLSLLCLQPFKTNPFLSVLSVNLFPADPSFVGMTAKLGHWFMIEHLKINMIIRF